MWNSSNCCKNILAVMPEMGDPMAYKCLKHVEQIISAIDHSVASSWFSSLRTLSHV